MFVTIGKQYINLLNATIVDEGAGGVLRISMSDGKVFYVRLAAEIALVKSAMEQLSSTPKPKKASA